MAWAIVDDGDVAWLGRWRWHLTPNGYAARSVRLPRKGQVYMHRAILGLEPGDDRLSDHVDRDRLNNRRANLRVVDRHTNPQNVSSHKDGTSAHRGVGWVPSRRKWRAQIYVDGHNRYLGLFRSEDEAAEAVRAARLASMPKAVD